jgi:hypothetical protein
LTKEKKVKINTLIISTQGDIHADALIWALRELGQCGIRWMPYALADSPVTASISPSRAAVVRLDGADVPFQTEGLRSVWFRRFTLPVLPGTMSASDKTVAEREIEGFLRGVTMMIAPQAFWANPPTTQRTAALKAPQLVAARSVGLTIPNTLFSNDMEQVRAFVKAASGPVIYKPFYPAVWTAGSKSHNAVTALMELEQLADPESLRLCPGIFQEFVAKAFELRVTIFGRTCIAARIFNQDAVDWRVGQHTMSIEPFQLPNAIEAKLLALMDALGLVMGSLDMIVTPDGEYVFLEINEQGQFLWAEQVNPEISLLEPLAHFFTAADPQFRWTQGQKPKIRYSDYVDSGAFQEFDQNVRLMKPAPNKFVVPDVA